MIPGQRWASQTEPELGLGLITQLEGRQVEILFPGSGGDVRRYAVAQAPLVRVRFQPGEQVRDLSGRTVMVESVEETDGLFLYTGAAGEQIPEAQLEGALAADRPFDRWFSGQSEPPEDFRFRKKVLEQRAACWASPVRGFLGGAMDLIPHQLYIAHEVSRRIQPRVLLADEVGLGKTIEACLIVHHLLLTGAAQRVLILVPDALVHQWFVELLRRFHLSFSLFDEARCEASPDGENPFLDEQTLICPASLLTETPALAVQAVDAEWDLVVVDEAHHYAWNGGDPDPGYHILDALSRQSAGLLLLTATPEQMGLEDHFARLRLLDSDRFHDFADFQKEHEQWEATAREARTALNEGQEERLEELLDRHGPGRVMFRNTRASMPGFPRRHLHVASLSDTSDEPHLNWLTAFLDDDPGRKVLVITSSRDRVDALYEGLLQRTGMDLARFHEAMPLLECDRQAAWFAEPEGARVLIASEIGGEGRNFQFVQHLVLLDLPEHPEMLEQRIGRLDRIGQRGDIHIHVPVAEHSRDAGRLRWFHEGLNAFEAPLSVGDALYREFHDRLNDVDDALIQETRTLRDRILREQEAGRDRLLELSSHRPEKSAELIQAVQAADEDPALEPFLLHLLDHGGIHAEHLQHRDYLLVRSHLFQDRFPFPRERMLMTLDRKRALEREDMDFVSWDHPLLVEGMEALCGSEQGRCSAGVSDTADESTVEFLFLLEPVAPPDSGVRRFLPPQPISVCLNLQGDPSAPPSEPIQSADPRSLLDHLGITPQRAAELADAAERSAQVDADRIRRDAAEVMAETLGREWQRLKALQSVNDMIRDEEIQGLADTVTDLQQIIQEARLRLDAVLLTARLASASGS